MLFEFFVPGISVAQGRPKFYRRGKHVGVYDPGKSRDWKAYVAWHVKQQLGDALDRPSERPLSMEVHFAFLRPKTLSKKIAYHIKKPDCKNLLAGVEDAMEGIVYRNDSQIWSIMVTKRYDDTAGVTIKIIEL